MKKYFFAPAEKGSSVIEAAIVMPLLLLFVVGIIQWGIIFAAHLTLRNASVAAARYAILTLPAPTTTNVETLAKNSVAPLLDPNIADPDYDDNASVSCGPSCTVTAKKVDISYDLPLFFSLVVPGSSGGVLTLTTSSVMR